MSTSGHSFLARLWAAGALAVIAAATSVASPMSPVVGAATPPVLQAVNLKAYAGVLADSSGMTLYVLSSEKGAVIHCHPLCLRTWVPVEVPNAVTSVTVGPGVDGAIGFVARTSTRKQITFNSYPVYRYIKDTAVGQANGEDLSTYAGTWLMAHAAATTARDTLVYPLLQSANAGRYTGVLANRAGRSMYLLSTEKGSVVHCTGGCLTRWIPLEVHSKTSPISAGRNVDGAIGLVARGSSAFQVTFNTYPIYTYVGDSGAGQTKGEGLVASGGTWFLVRASATTVRDTPILPLYP